MQGNQARFQSGNAQNSREDEIKNLIKSHYAFIVLSNLEGTKRFPLTLT
jgi:hypothetical protein